MDWNNLKNLFDTTLLAGITNVATSMTVPTGIGAALPPTPFIGTLSVSTSVADLKQSERVQVTEVIGDTLTITREYDGSTAPIGGWAAGTKFLLLVTATHFMEIHENCDRLEAFIAMSFGGGDGLIRAGSTYDCLVEAQGSPTMSVHINTGYGFISRRATQLAIATDKTIVAPVTNPRIDIVQLKNDDTITVKTGIEGAVPAAPAIDSGCIKLAEIYCRVGMTSIKNTDDATNGYLTDSRSYV